LDEVDALTPRGQPSPSQENLQGHKIRLFFLPAHSPELNPDEQVWNEIKHRGVENKPIKNKSDLEYRLYDGLEKLKKNVEKVCSFFKLKNTKYASLDQCPA